MENSVGSRLDYLLACWNHTDVSRRPLSIDVAIAYSTADYLHACHRILLRIDFHTIGVPVIHSSILCSWYAGWKGASGIFLQSDGNERAYNNRDTFASAPRFLGGAEVRNLLFSSSLVLCCFAVVSVRHPYVGHRRLGTGVMARNEQRERWADGCYGFGLAIELAIANLLDWGFGVLHGDIYSER